LDSLPGSHRFPKPGTFLEVILFVVSPSLKGFGRFWRPDLRDQVELPKTGEVALRGVGKHLAILMHPGTAPSNVARLAASVGFGS
jgi:hypothetical protein